MKLTGLWAGVLVLLLAGCATTRQSIPPSGAVIFMPLSSVPNHAVVHNFHAVGRWEMDGLRHASGYFDWQHTPVLDTLSLMNGVYLPLAELERKEGHVVVNTSDGKHLTESAWLNVSQQMLGVPLRLPLEPLSYWIQGRFSPGMSSGNWLLKPSDAESLGNYSGEQDGWRLTWTRLSAVSSESWIPDRLQLKLSDVTYILTLTIDQESSVWK